ncbi:MAG: SGNH/GDSL hydrolase family protein [Kiritimatiellae bacterium]|nr:SGNH/GDSL hydrolase family protein [Kiritimatiellia bacterium]MDD5522018.1 SGNH/GDSL hydrolase family protein [Kiritimatiellia bacterium]
MNKKCVWFGVACILFLASFIDVVAQTNTPGDVKKPASERKGPAFAEVVDDPGLPRVLLIGDSISIGYTPIVRELLKGKVNVHRPPTNCAATIHGLKQLDAWLGNGKWDVIHFNWGLHDLKYMDEKGTITDVSKGKQQVPVAEYENNLRELVQRLKKTGAKLIWCATTPVPEGAGGRITGDVVKYNETALKVMKEGNVAVDDLYAVAFPRLAELQKPRNVHFKPEGSKVLAENVVKSIMQQLGQ